MFLSNQKFSRHKPSKTSFKVWTPVCRKTYTMLAQWCAVCWGNLDYRFDSSVPSMLSGSQWPSFEHCRHFTRLHLFYNITYQASVLELVEYFSKTSYPTYHHHPLRFVIAFIRCNNYKYSFYPRTICD